MTVNVDPDGWEMLLAEQFSLVIGLLRKALTKFKRQIFNKKNLRYFIYYALVNFLILILYTIYERLQPVNLELKPVTSPTVEGSSLLFVAAVMLLPLTLFLEECGFRLLPMVMVKDVLRLNVINVEEERTWRLWLFRNWILIFIVVSAIWAAFWHQVNIVESSALGSLIYFGVQFFSGCCLAWIYAHRGFGASWIIHTIWDLFLIALSLLMVML